MTFDPETFMNQTLDAPLEIERTLIPEGEYRMSVDDFTSDAFETYEFTYKRGPRSGSEGSMTTFNCPIVVDDDKLKAELQTEKPMVFYRCTLDFNDDGSLATGPNKNIDLGKLRHAVGQNQQGNWSINMLRGAGPFMGKVQHRQGKRKDGTPFKVAEIVKMAPLR
jgi:hypothetical protein